MSFAIATVTVAVSSPAAKLTVPLVAVKSTPEVALPPVVVKSTEDAPVVSPDRVMVKTATPASSATVTSSTDSSGGAEASTIVVVTSLCETTIWPSSGDARKRR